MHACIPTAVNLVPTARHATATYVGIWLLNNVLWSVYVAFPCLCALSASTFIDSSLYQLDFFPRFLFRNLFMETRFCSCMIRIKIAV